jgi:hypothetical protein
MRLNPLNKMIFLFVVTLIRSCHTISSFWQPLQKHGYGFGSVLEYRYGPVLWLSVSLNGIEFCLFSDGLVMVSFKSWLKPSVKFYWFVSGIGFGMVMFIFSMYGFDYCNYGYFLHARWIK